MGTKPWGVGTCRASRPSNSRRSRMRVPSFILLLLFFLPSCRSTGGGAPFAPVPPESADAVWRELQSRVQSFEGARSYLRLRLTDAGRTRAFNARFFASKDGRVLLDALTPVGTTAFTLYLDGASAMWIDEIHSTYWEGSVADVAPLARFIGRGVDSRSFALTVVGLPAQDTVDSEVATYAVGNAGLASVAFGSGAASLVEYSPPAFPPSKLVFTTAAAPDTSLQVEHLELTAGPQKVERPPVPRGYARATPVL